MTKKDIEAIKHVEAIREYCHECNDCRSCVLRTEDISENFIENACMFEDDRAPEDWDLPIVKTYKQDFLEKFPKTDFDADCICRKYLYPDGEKYSDCDGCGTCENCWNEAYIKVSAEEQSQ